MYVYVYIYMYIYVYIYIYIYVCDTQISIYTCIYIYTYIHIHIYIYISICILIASLCPQVEGNGLERSMGGEDSLSDGSWQDKSTKIDLGSIREDLGSRIECCFRRRKR